MADEVVTTDQAEQGQAIIDSLIDDLGDPIDSFGEVSQETTTPAPVVTETTESTPAVGDVIPPAADTATAGSGDGVGSIPAATQTVSFPDELLSISGLSEQQARDVFGTPEKLYQAMTDFDRRMAETGRQQMTRGPAERTPPAPTPATAADPPKPPQAEASSPSMVKPFNWKNPKEWDDATKKLIDEVNDHWAKQLETQAQQMQQMQQVLEASLSDQRARAEQEYVQRFDQMCDSLGDEWKEVFGTGPGSKLEPTSTAYKNRVELDRTMLAVSSAMRSAGQRPLTAQQLYQRSLQITFPKQFEATIRSRLLGQAKTRQAQFTLPPTGRSGKALTGDERANAAVRKFLTDRGETVTPYEEGPDEV